MDGDEHGVFRYVTDETRGWVKKERRSIDTGYSRHRVVQQQRQLGIEMKFWRYRLGILHGDHSGPCVFELQLPNGPDQLGRAVVHGGNVHAVDLNDRLPYKP